MKTEFPDTPAGYHEAYNAAVLHARRLNHAVGLEKVNWYGKRLISMKLIPNDPSKRFGWETRCEVVTPDMPLTVDSH